MGRRLATAGALSVASFAVLKVVTGRSRPDAERGAYDFHPFSGHRALPSGHSTLAFTLATTLADAVNDPWATVGLYAVAAGTAWSRVYDRRH